jgi:hypothetical protein
MDDHPILTIEERSMSNETILTILNDMEEVLGRCEITIRDKNRCDDGFCMEFDPPTGLNYSLNLNIKLCSECDMITLNLDSSLAASVDKFPLLEELAGRINREIGFYHLIIDREHNRISLNLGIMIDNGVLDQTEFDFAIRLMKRITEVWFPVIYEQLSTDEQPETLMKRGNKSSSTS